MFKWMWTEDAGHMHHASHVAGDQRKPGCCTQVTDSLRLGAVSAPVLEQPGLTVVISASGVRLLDHATSSGRPASSFMEYGSQQQRDKVSTAGPAALHCKPLLQPAVVCCSALPGSAWRSLCSMQHACSRMQFDAACMQPRQPGMVQQEAVKCVSLMQSFAAP